MSKPAPPPAKQSFIQTLLLATMIFIGVQLLFNRGGNAPTAPPQDLLAKMRQQNRDLLDVDVAGTLHQFNQQVDQDLNKKRSAADEALKQKKLSEAEAANQKKAAEDEAQRLKIEAAILAADTQLKAGIKANKSDRVRDAYHTLVGVNRQLRDDPLWNTPVAVADVSGDQQLGWKEWTGRALYDRTIATLSNFNKTDMVWGFIPGYQLMDFLVNLTGANPGFSYAFAAFLLALLVRAVVFRLATKQIMSGRQMSQLMPLVKEIKDKFPNDQVTQNQKTMELYKEYGVNPFAGCGPALVQMPLFYTIYLCMLHYQFEFEKGTFLWINPATSKATNGFIAPNLGQQDTILVIIYGITMLITTLMMPVGDPSQARQQRLMGVGMTVLFTFFMFTGAVPVVSGFVLYWIFTNILATTQTLILYRQPLPPLQKVNTKAGGVYPQGGAFGGRMAKFMEKMQAAQEEQMRRQQGGDAGGNGKPSNSNGNGQVFLGTGETKTGTPAKHKPKKRK